LYNTKQDYRQMILNDRVKYVVVVNNQVTFPI